MPVFALGVELTPERPIQIVAEGLKNLAVAYAVPILGKAASDTERLKGKRVRFEDLVVVRASSMKRLLPLY
jgi:hypothetical protein